MRANFWLEVAPTCAEHPSLGHAAGVLLLSRMTGLSVLSPDGGVVGRLADLTVELGEQPGRCLVKRLLVQRHRAPDLLSPWAAVESFRHTALVLAHGTDDPATFAITSITETLGDDEILLGRDVLDTQVIDVVGQRLARVAEVVLARTSQNRLELVGVEVGFGGVLRRLGLRRLAARAGEDALAWDRPAPDLGAGSCRAARNPAIGGTPPRRARTRCTGEPARHRVGHRDSRRQGPPRRRRGHQRQPPGRGGAGAAGDAPQGCRRNRSRHARRSRDPMAGPPRRVAHAPGQTLLALASLASPASRPSRR